MHKVIFSIFIIVVAVCLHSSSVAHARQNKATVQRDMTAQQLEKRIMDVDNARRDDAHKQRIGLENLLANIDTMLEKHQNIIKEISKQETDKTKDWVAAADKRLEWGVYIITALIGIMAIICTVIVFLGAFIIIKTSRDAREANIDAKKILDDAKTESKDKLLDLKKRS